MDFQASQGAISFLQLKLKKNRVQPGKKVTFALNQIVRGSISENTDKILGICQLQASTARHHPVGGRGT
jgi:hypothetical protein